MGGWKIPNPAEDAMPSLMPDPKSRELASHTLLLSQAEYDRFLRRGKSDRYPPIAQQPRLDRLSLFDLFQRVSMRMISRLMARFHTDPPSSRTAGPGLELTEKMKPIYDRLKAAVGRIGKPVKVVYIPEKREILADRGYKGSDRVRDFAAFLSAEFYDGRDAFRPLSPRERVKCFFPIDGHWNQVGSNLFGEYVYRKVLSPSEGWPSIGNRPERPAVGPKNRETGSSRVHSRPNRQATDT
jgi:hypothetical protein